MKRYGNLFDKIVTTENLNLADKKARRGKRHQYGVQKHIKNSESNILELKYQLFDERYKTSEYTNYTITDPKTRVISKLPFFPDRICQHAIINVLEPIFVKMFTTDTYSCIKGRGVHKASYGLRGYLKDTENTKYCLKMDIRKFYPSVDNDILKDLLLRKFKDKKVLNLMFEIINSYKGLPLGNVTSQFFANYYLTYFDRFIKEKLGVKYYLRYCDDLVILSNSKEHLHSCRKEVEEYLKDELNLILKDNYQVFPVGVRGIDFVGYKHYHTHTLLRKSIKKNYVKSKNKANWNGWLVHCNSINLKRKHGNN